MDKREDFDMDFDFEKEYGFDPSLMNNNYEEEPEFLSIQRPADSIPAAPQNYVEDASDYGNMFQAPSYDEAPAPYYDTQPEEPAYDEEQPQYDPQPVAEEIPQRPRRREKRSKRSSLFAPKPISEPEPPAPVREETVYFDESEPEYTPESLPVVSPVAPPETITDVPVESEQEAPMESAPEAPRNEQRRRRKPTKEQVFK